MIAALVLAVDFMNFTYETNPCAQNVPVPAVMRKGEFDYFDKRMGAGFTLTVKSVTRGSLAPGTRQALVELSCLFPADGGVDATYLFDERPGRARLVAKVAVNQWGTDWSDPPTRVRFERGMLAVQKCADDGCSSSILTTYTLRGGKLVAVSLSNAHQR